MLLKLMSGIGVIISAIFAIGCYSLYKNLRDDTSYSLGRIFLKKNSIRVFALIVVCFLIFAAARIVSFFIILSGITGAVEMKIISFVRAPMDMLSAILLTISILILYTITRRPRS